MTKNYIFFGFLGALLSIVLRMGFDSFFESLELKAYDTRLHIRGSVPTHPDIIMVDADTSSEKILGPWKWDRSVHAKMINFLMEKGARKVVYDILFDRPQSPASDQQLIHATKTTNSVLFPIEVRLQDSENIIPSEQSHEVDGNTFYKENIHSKSFLSVGNSENDINFPFQELIKAANGLGHVAANRDQDGIIRRAPLLVRYQGKLIPSLAFEATIKFLEPSQVLIQENQIVLSGIRFQKESFPKDIYIPIDSRGQMLINYAGKWGTFPHYSFASLITEEPTKIAKINLQGKLILITGVLDGRDIKSIPLENIYPGGGILTNIANTILTRNFIQKPGQTFELLLILLLCLITTWIFISRKYSWHMVGVGILICSFLAVNMALFFNGLVLEIFAPIFSIFLTALITATFKANKEKTKVGKLSADRENLKNQILKIERLLEDKSQELERIQKLIPIKQEQISSKPDEASQPSAELNELENDYETITAEKINLEQIIDKLNDDFRSFPDEELSEQLTEECRQMGIITQNKEVLKSFQILQQYASATTPILILGESGTGKELFAKAVHHFSPRKNKQFIGVNIGAIPNELIESELFGHAKGAFSGAIATTRGVFENAHRGTLFLDEIGDASKNIQIKMLRALEEKEIQRVGERDIIKIDTRIISATNKNLREEVANGNFREDLYYRLNVLKIMLPPLRERKDDIELLANYFMKIFREEHGFDNLTGYSQGAIHKLQAYSWPGNIRELRNIIDGAVLKTQKGLITEHDIVLDDIYESKTQIFTSYNEDMFLGSLRKNRFDINQTKSELNITRNTVTLKFKGICFESLVKNNFDVDHTANAIAGEDSLKEGVLKKITEYYENLIKSIKNHENANEAIREYIKSSRIPVQYNPVLEQIIRHYFGTRNI
jgi:transcriptional regulator with PAS, ATPase and Fis domain/CHASE2 domain-containing sensor protein